MKAISRSNAIIDCDPGWDDAAAICLALLSEARINLLALSTVFGNSHANETTDNASYILNLLSRNDIALVEGAHKPKHGTFAKSLYNANDAFDDFKLSLGLKTEFSKTTVQRNWPKTVVDSITSQKITVFCLGPLTNIPLIASIFKYNCELIILGGSFGKGNFSTKSEFNFALDSISAMEVMSLGCEKTIIPLEICYCVPAIQFLDVFRNSSSKAARIWESLIIAYLKRNASSNFPPSLYDPIAILYFLFPEAFKTEEKYVTVLISNDENNGSLQVHKGGDKVRFVVDVNLRELKFLTKNLLT